MSDSPVKSKFESLFANNNEKIYRFALKLTGDASRAQDITQQCFIRLWEHIDKVEEGQDIFPLLFVYVKHLVIDEARRHYREKKLIAAATEEQKTQPSSDDNVERYVIRKEFDQQMNSAVQQLPEQRKNVYMLSRYHGYSNKEIADKLSISVATVKNHLGLAMQAIKQQVSAHFDIEKSR